MNTKLLVTVDGCTSLETGVPPTKESYISSHSAPWYRRKKQRIFVLICSIAVIGVIVGGAVGGTIPQTSKDPKNKGPGNGAGLPTVTPPTPTVTLPTSTVTLPTSTSSSISSSPPPTTVSPVSSQSTSESTSNTVVVSTGSGGDIGYPTLVPTLQRVGRR